MIDLEEEFRDARRDPVKSGGWVSDGVAFVACSVLVVIVGLVIAGMAKLAEKMP